MADKLMNILNNDTQNYPFSRLRLVVETFGQSRNQSKLRKVPKVVRPTNKNCYYKQINSPISPPSLVIYTGTKSFITKLSYSLV